MKKKKKKIRRPSTEPYAAARECEVTATTVNFTHRGNYDCVAPREQILFHPMTTCTASTDRQETTSQPRHSSSHTVTGPELKSSALISFVLPTTLTLQLEPPCTSSATKVTQHTEAVHSTDGRTDTARARACIHPCHRAAAATHNKSMLLKQFVDIWLKQHQTMKKIK